jgi:hypothetical protein
LKRLCRRYGNKEETNVRFRAVLEEVPGSSATFVRVPPAVMKKFGGRIRVPVRVTINGAEHRTTICDMGMGPMLGIPAAMRKAAGIERGRRISLDLGIDRDERVVDVPTDFAKAMRATERRVFDGLAYTHRKEYVLWIEGAKKPETRLSRIAKAREKLRERS